MSVGPKRARNGAATAAVVIAARNATPGSSTHLRRVAVRARRCAWWPGSVLAEAVIGAPNAPRPSLVPHPWIEQAVERVGTEVDHDEPCDADQDHGLRHEVVPGQDRAPEHAAEARNREDGLGDHGAADEEPGLNPQHRDDRNE